MNNEQNNDDDQGVSNAVANDVVQLSPVDTMAATIQAVFQQMEMSRLVQKPQIYKTGMDFTLWIERFNVYLQQCKIVTDTAKVSELWQFLDLETTFSSAKQLDIDPSASYDEVLKRFKLRFAKFRSAEDAKMTFEMRNQNSKETYEDYADVLKKLAIDAYPNPGYSSTIRDELCRDRFRRGALVANEVRQKLYLDKPSSLEATVALANWIETSLKQSQDNSVKKSAERVNTFQQKCLWCGSEQHLAINCPPRLKSERKFENNASSSRSRNDSLFCTYCSRSGHDDESCFKRQRANPKSRGDSLFCTYCNRSGHDNKSCFKKQRDESASNSARNYQNPNIRRNAQQTTNYFRNENFNASTKNKATTNNAYADPCLSSATNKNKSISSKSENQSKVQQHIYKDSPTGTTPYCIIEANGYELQVLIDSGASLSLLSKRVVDKLQIPEKNITKYVEDQHIVQFGNGDTGSLYGHCEFTFSVSGGVFTHTFRIMENLVDGVIFGSDFLLEKGGLVDYNRLQLTFFKSDAVIPFRLQSQTPKFCRVFTKERIKIPGNSEQFVDLRLEYGNYVNNGAPGLIESCRSPEKARIVLSRSLVVPKEDAFSIKVANLSDKPQVLHKGAAMGFYSPLKNEIISEFDKDVKVELPKYVPPHLRKLQESLNMPVNIGDSDATEEQKGRLLNLLNKYRDVFANSEEELGDSVTPLMQMEINTGDALPIKQNARRIPPPYRKEVDAYLDDLLKRGKIRESHSPWASPLVIVLKKDKSLRVCVDMRALNEVTVKDAISLPRVQDCLEALSGSKVFSVLDARSGYHQIGLTESSKPKTAFVTPHRGQYEFTCVPFGVTNGVGQFVRLMNLALHGTLWKDCLAYIDDLIVYSTSVENHLQKLQIVLEKLKLANVKLHPKKCHFLCKSVKLLGHVVSDKGIETDPEKISTVVNWPTPNNLKELRSFLGFAQYYKKFVLDYSSLSAPLV
jgi:hypothetical protein